MTGLGAASADAIYGTIAGFGLTAVSGALLDHQTAIRFGGGILLLYLGIQTIRAEPTETAATPADTRGLIGDYVSTFVLTLTNPVTVIAFVGIFAGLGVGLSGEYVEAATLVLGVFVGSACWWLLLSSGVDLFRGRFTRPFMRRVDQLAGLILVGFGLFALASIV